MRFGDYTPDLVKYEDGSFGVYNEFPTCRMSVLELPAMMFHMMLCGSEATEALIKSEVGKYQKLFEAMAQGKLSKANIGTYGIAMADIPQKVIDCVNERTSGKNVNDQLAKMVDDALTDTGERIERLKSDKRSVNSAQNKMGKRGFRSIQPGKLADWLAADIVKHQPSKYSGDSEEYGTDRLTGMNYRVMQSMIATFNGGDTTSQSLDELKAMFAKAQLIQNREKAHPFLAKALNRNPQTTVDLYEQYLVAKRAYYQHLRGQLQNGEKVTLPYLNRCRNKWEHRNASFYKKMGEIYTLDVPIELPRQMFDDAIKAALKKLPSMSGVDFEHSNVTFLIGEYLKRELKDDFQPFYEWKRNYRFTDMMICQENRATRALSSQFIPLMLREEIWEKRGKLKEDYKKWAISRLDRNPDTRRLSEAEKNDLLDTRIAKCRNEYQKNERAIRRYKVQDVVMFMMVKAMFAQLGSAADSKQFSLSLIMPDAERGILSEVMPIDFTFNIDGEKYTIHSNGMKLKNYGDFFRLINDKRMKSLARILTNHTIDKDLLDKEFCTYDDRRPEAIEIIFQLEKAAYAKYPELNERLQNEYRFDFSDLLNVLEGNNDLASGDAYKLSQIRNAFCHNAYPRTLNITSNIPQVAQDMIKVLKASDPFENNKLK